MDESEMIRRAQAGDRHAFGALFDTYYGCVYRYLNERLGGAPEAEDLCQEVFLTVLGSIDQFHAGDALGFDEWLLRVAHRLATEHHRRHIREKQRPPLDTVPASAPPATAIKRQLNHEAISLLPDSQQQVVTYRYHAGLSVRQTAAALGLDTAMVRRIGRVAMETWLRYAPPVGDLNDT